MAVHEDGKVEFSASEFAFAYIDGVAEAACSAGLLGDKLVADHFVCEHFGFGGSAESGQSKSGGAFYVRKGKYECPYE